MYFRFCELRHVYFKIGSTVRPRYAVVAASCRKYVYYSRKTIHGSATRRNASGVNEPLTVPEPVFEGVAEKEREVCRRHCCLWSL